MNGLIELGVIGVAWAHVPQNWGFQCGIVTMATRITIMAMSTAVEVLHILLVVQGALYQRAKEAAPLFEGRKWAGIDW